MMNYNDDRSLAFSSIDDKKSDPLTCVICGKQFSNEKRYFGHLRIHSGEVILSCESCPLSDASFDSQSRLKIHENSCHSLVRPFKCSKCDNVFDRASQLDYHVRSLHLRERSQICQICGKGFFRKNDLQTHLNVHLGTNQSICEICGRKFNHVSNLIRHCRTHAGSKPYPCTICGKRFTQISSLARHKRIHERESKNLLDNEINAGETNHEISENTADPSKIEKKKSTKRQHYCRICGESFQFMVLLRQHKRLHTKAIEIGKVNDEKIASNSIQSSINDWRDIPTEKNMISDNDVANSTDHDSSKNLISDHLMELARKMNSIEIDTERDVSISISDILSPYNSNEIELSNDDTLEPKLYENSSNKNNLEKDYDIVQCLNGVDFETNVNSELSDPSNVKSQEKIMLKSQSKESNMEKLKFTSLAKDLTNKFLPIEGSQLYIEICESEYLKSSNMQDLSLEEIENVDTFQEDCFDSSRVRTDIVKNLDREKKSSKNNEDRDLRIDEIKIDGKEPTLRLVNTEIGEQFYELVVNNPCNDFENQNVVRNNETARSMTLSISEDDGQTLENQSENFNKSTNESVSSEFFQLPNIENYRDIQNSLPNDTTQMPMVRLVQNEDGEQFFELIREPLECEKNRDKNSESTSISEVGADNSNNFDITNQTKPIVSNSGVKREKKEITTENVQRTTKDRTRKFQCTECDKWFSTAYNFKQHAGTHFSDQQKFHCKECGLSFAWKSTLNKHLAGNHRPDGPQKFVCEICPKVYSTLSQVNEHVKRDHLKERNHVCTLCDKSFFKKFDLKTHSRTHTNERPYICRACGKGFHHQSHIIRHERTHSGERPYECNICQRTFTQPGSLRSHRQRHRDVKIDILEYRMDEDDPLTLAVQ